MIKLLLILLLLTSTAQADITSGLVAWYKLDEGSGTTANDSSGSSFNGSLINSATYTAGKIGPYAVSLVRASTQYIHIPNLVVSGYPFTMSAWVNMASNTQGVIASINAGANIGGSGINRGDIFYATSAGGTGCFYFQDNANNNTIACGGSITVGTWAMLTGVFASPTSYVLYVNGTNVASTAGPLTLNFTLTTETDIGTDSDATNLTDGAVDDVRFYNRALSAGDVAQLYAYTGITNLGITINNAKIANAKFNT